VSLVILQIGLLVPMGGDRVSWRQHNAAVRTTDATGAPFRRTFQSLRRGGPGKRAPGLRASAYSFILNKMVQYTNAHLDASFAALSDVTRRGVLERLGRAEASITELAEKFNMTLTGMKKHVGVLEQAGLVITAKVGRVRTCRVGPDRLEEATAWLDKYRQLWAERFDELDKVIEALKQSEKVHGRKKRVSPSP
jgi:DNA-binding transcriptional ArsR family regulator